MHRLLRLECRNLLRRRSCVLLLIFILIKLVISFSALTPTRLVDPRIYRDYMEQMAGPLTEETHTFVQAEQERLNQATEQTHTLQAQSDGEQKAVFQVVLEKYDYFQSRSASTLPAPEFFYDLDWESFLQRNTPDFLLLLALLLVIIPYFTNDFESGMYPLVRSMPDGRSRLLGVRLLCSCGVMLLLGFVLSVIELGGFYVNYGFENANAPVQSIQLFGDCPYALSVLEYAVISRMITALWCVPATCIAAVIALFQRRALSAAFLGWLALVIPAFGYDIFPHVLRPWLAGAQLLGVVPLQADGVYPVIASLLSFGIHLLLGILLGQRFWCGTPKRTNESPASMK